MAAQPGKGKVQKSLKYGVNLLDSDEEGNSSEPESSESDDNTPDTTATAPAAGAGAPAKKAAKAKGKKPPSLYVLQTTNSPPGRRPRVEIDQNTDLSLLH